VSNYQMNRNFLWQNDGTGHFTEIARDLGLAGIFYLSGDLEVWGHTIGSDWGDFNSDGHLDLIVGNLAHPAYLPYSDKTFIYFNHGWGQGFTNFINSSGIAYEETHSSPSWADYNNDGLLDFYITSIYDGRYSFLYKNLGVYPNTFQNVTVPLGVRVTNGWGCAWADVDKDGDADLFVCSASGCKFFLNNGNSNSYLRVVLKPANGAATAIGARVTCTAGASVQVREVDGGHGTGCQRDSTLLFGFGSYAGTVNVDVRWPLGGMNTLAGQTLNQTLTVNE
jgi:hypothetical protein